MRSKWVTMMLVTATAAATLCGCKKGGGEEMVTPGAQPTGTPTVTGTVELPFTTEEYNEAKMLQELVEKRLLPAMEKRIPSAEGIFVEKLPQQGAYGERLHLAAVTADEITGELVSEGLFRYGADGTIEPNVAKSYTVNSDFTVYTISLREGMRWSDGVPFTADDVLFFYDKMYRTNAFGAGDWSCFTAKKPAGGTAAAVLNKVDNMTFTVTFSTAKPEFFKELIAQGGICFAPEHYYVNLLPEYMGEDAALAKAKDMGYKDTAEMLRDTVLNAWNIPGIPTVNAYLLSEEEGADDVTGNYYEFVRNPYYWKLDESGKQLPYLDVLEFTRISDESQGVLLTTEGYLSVSRVATGQLDTVRAGAARGNYRVVEWSGYGAFAVNNSLQNFPDSPPYDAAGKGLGAAKPYGWFFR